MQEVCPPGQRFGLKVPKPGFFSRFETDLLRVTIRNDFVSTFVKHR